MQIENSQLSKIQPITSLEDYKNFTELIQQVKNDKITQDIIRITYKQNQKYSLQYVIPNLMNLFIQGSISAGNIITKGLSAEIKFQGSFEYQSIPKATEQSIIALPSQSDIYSSNKPLIVLHSAETQDAKTQRVNQYGYYKQDQLILPTYLDQKFKTIKRQGITHFFQQAALIVCEKLEISSILSGRLLNEQQQKAQYANKFDYLSKFSQLLECISPSIYTFHLINLLQTFTITIEHLLKSMPKNILYQNFRKQNFQQIIYTIENISQRWRQIPIQNSKINTKKWQFQLKKVIIGKLLDSQISQQQLYAVKNLCQICRRCDLSMSGPSLVEILQFIQNSKILQKIYRPNNHPQVIMKGKDIFQFVCKNCLIDSNHIAIIFNLLDKSHQQVCKVLYQTIQGIGQSNLEKNRGFMMNQILKFTRASFFYEDTFTLIQMLMLLTPLEFIEDSLGQLYSIMEKHYPKLKKSLKQRVVNIYFQLFVIGVQENMFQDKDDLTVLKPILNNLQTQLAFLMIEAFVLLLQRQKGKKIQQSCNRIMLKAIKCLFTVHKIHEIKLSKQYRKTQLKLLNFLLQVYYNHIVNQQMIINYQGISMLMNQDISFCRYVQYYQSDKQIQVLKTLLNKNIQNNQKQFSKQFQINIFIQVYQRVNQNVQKQMLPQIYQIFIKTNNQSQKYKFGKIYYDLSKKQRQNIINQVINNLNQEDTNQLKLWSNLILLKYLIEDSDKKGYGSYPPYSHYGKAYQTKVHVINSMDVLIPTQFDLTISNHKTIFDLISKILQIINVQISKVKIRLGQKFITLDDFQLKIIDIYPYKQCVITVFQSIGCQWFDKCQLISNGVLNSNVINALIQIHANYSQNGKMYRKNCAKVCQIATDTQKITLNDTRVSYIFNKYSQNGQFLTTRDWINFYFESSITDPCLVVENLKKLGYGHLFKQPDFMNTVVNVENTCRQSLSKSNIVNLLLSNITIINNNKQIEQLCIKILNILPLSQYFLKQVLNLSCQANHKINFRQLWYIGGIINRLVQMKDQNPLSAKQYKIWKQKLIISQLYAILIDGVLQECKRLQLKPYQIESISMMLSVERQKYKNISNLSTINILQMSPIKVKKFSNRINYEQIQKLFQKICYQENNIQIIQTLLIILISPQIHKQCQQTIQQQYKIKINKNFIFYPHQKPRKLFNNFYYLLSQICPQIIKQYYNIQCQNYCQQYFIILTKFIAQQTQDQILINSYKQLQQIIQKNNIQNNQILLGRLKLLSILKTCNPNLQISIQWLKKIQSKCLSELTRQVYYNLLIRVCSTQYNIKNIQSMVSGVQLAKNSVYRGKQYVGLFNLGCICYINATIQQLFMIEPFRNTILEAKLNGQIQKRDQYFEYFQQIFYQLAYSQRMFFIPSEFCENYLDYANAPINIKQQHDADEFLNQLLDRLQQTLNSHNNPTSRKYICGQMTNTIQCQQCLTLKTKIQDFYIISLQIKGLNNLEQCLNKLIQPQVICDYYCQQCQKKVQKILKYHHFHQLPKYLFIHLQRLVFDLELFTKVKLDHPVQFPLEMDLQSYFNNKVTMLNQQSVTYRLRGFIVHIGTSQSGHYYSLIRINNNWVKFDDNRLQGWEWGFGSRQKQSAYMLIYQKIDNHQQYMQKHIQTNNKLFNKVKKDNQNLMRQTIILHQCFPKYIQNTLKKIQIPQTMLLNSPNSLLIPYHPKYQDISYLAQKLAIGSRIVLQYLSLLTQIRDTGLTYNTSTKNNNSHINIPTQTIKHLGCYYILFIHLNPIVAQEQLIELIQKYDVLRIIATNSDPLLRQVYKMILIKLISLVSVKKQNLLLIRMGQQKILNKILIQIMSFIQQIGKHYSKMQQFFQLLFCICQTSKQCLEWFQANLLLPKLIHCMLQNDSLFKNQFKSIPTSYLGSKKIDYFNTILQILQILTLANPPNWQMLPTSFFELSKKIYKQKYNYKQLNRILCHYSYQNQQLTDNIIGLLKSNINRFSHDDSYIYAYLHLAHGFLMIQDKFQKRRLQMVLGVPIVNIPEDFYEVKQVKKELDIPQSQNIMQQQIKQNKQNLIQKSYKTVSYISSKQKDGDQHFLPLLQIIYLNRNQLTYFSILAVTTLFRIISANKQIYQYILQMPSSITIISNNNRQQIKQDAIIGQSLIRKDYLQWITIFIKNFLNDGNLQPPKMDKNQIPKKRFPLSQINQHQLMNEIANLLRQIENQQYLSQITNKQKQIIQSYQILKQGVFKKLQTIQLNNQDIINIKQIENRNIKIEYQLIQSKNINRFILYLISTDSELKLEFNQNNYNYTIYLDVGNHQICIPFQNNFISSFHCQIVGEKKRQNKIDIQKNDINNPKECQEKNNNNKQADENPAFECPFCGVQAQIFRSSCSNCGQEWGQMF